MAKRNDTIPFRIFIKDTATGETFNWDGLSEAQRDSYRARMSDNLSRRMSDYYSAHPDEYEKL